MTIYGDGTQHRAFSYIDDIMEPLLKAAIDPKSKNKIINLGGKSEISILEACRIMGNITGSSNYIKLESRHEVKMAWSTYEKSVELLDYKENISFEEGLRRMWSWVNAQPRRERKLWESYEIDKGVYSFWKLT